MPPAQRPAPGPPRRAAGPEMVMACWPMAALLSSVAPNKARSVRHDAAGHMGKLGRRTPPQDGLMEAASLWRGGDSHRSGPVVLPTQQISDLKRSGKQETQPATTAQCFSPGNDRGSTKHSSVPPWHDDERLSLIHI